MGHLGRRENGSVVVGVAGEGCPVPEVVQESLVGGHQDGLLEAGPGGVRQDGIPPLDRNQGMHFCHDYNEELTITVERMQIVTSYTNVYKVEFDN